MARLRRSVGSFGILRRARVPRIATVILAVAAVVATSACGVRQGGLDGASTPVRFPERIIPAEGLLGYEVVREPLAEDSYHDKSSTKLLVTDGRVFTIRRGSFIEGALQVSLFRPDVDSQDAAIQREVERSIAPSFTTYRFGTVKLRMHESPQQRIFLRFPPGTNTMEVFVLRKQFADGLRVVRAAVAYQRGLDPNSLAGTVLLPVPDAEPPPTDPIGGAFPVPNP